MKRPGHPELADGFPDFQKYLLRKVFCQIRVMAEAMHKTPHPILASLDNLLKSLDIPGAGKSDHDRFGSLAQSECPCVFFHLWFLSTFIII